MVDFEIKTQLHPFMFKATALLHKSRRIIYLFFPKEFIKEYEGSLFVMGTNIDYPNTIFATEFFKMLYYNMNHEIIHLVCHELGEETRFDPITKISECGV